MKYSPLENDNLILNLYVGEKYLYSYKSVKPRANVRYIFIKRKLG